MTALVSSAATTDTLVMVSVVYADSNTHSFFLSPFLWHKIMSSGSLCFQCRNIDFDSIFKADPRQNVIHAGIQCVARLRDNPEAGCTLCEFFQHLQSPSPASCEGKDTLRLYLFHLEDYDSDYFARLNPPPNLPKRSPLQPALGVFWLTQHDADHFKTAQGTWHDELPWMRALRLRMCSSLREKGFISSHRKTALGESATCQRADPLNPERADFDKIQHWLKRCQIRHKACSNPALGKVWPAHLINCTSLDVEPVHVHHEYIALSYAWGGKGAKEYSKSLKDIWERLPMTIKDAVAVTKKLGFQYLWIDYFCIPQEDEIAKQAAIRSMGSIYSHASLVVIAASGTDADGGLPGVGRIQRNRQLSVPIGQHILVSSMMHPIQRIRRSKWATRGWTYQEERSARRKLYFTEDQVYFECESSSCAEVYLATKEWPNLSGTGDNATTASLVESLNFYKSSGPRDHWSHVQEVSRRELTRAEDVLDSIAGVLRLPLPSHSDIPGHLQGIPLRGSLGVLPEPGFFSKNLCWALDGPGNRRQGFPTWSWTGWRGQPVSPPNHNNRQAFLDHGPLLRLAYSSNVQVQVESSATKRLVDISELYRQHLLDTTHNRPGVHILCITTQVYEFSLCLLPVVDGRPSLPAMKVLQPSNKVHPSADHSQKASSATQSSGYYVSIRARTGILYAQFLPTGPLSRDDVTSHHTMLGLKLFHSLRSARGQGCPDHRERSCTPLLMLGVRGTGSKSNCNDAIAAPTERLGMINLRELYQQSGTSLKRIDLGACDIELPWQRRTVRVQ